MTVHDASPPVLSQSKSRLAVMAAVFMAGYFAVALRLADLTLLQSKPVAEATGEEGVKPLAVPLRAAILDRNGDIMATSLKMSSLYVDATLVTDAPALAARIAGILPGQSREELAKKLSSGKKFVWIRRDVTPRQVWALNALGEPALGFQEEDRRMYPAGALTAHVVGYTDVDGGGLAGLERAFDAELRAGKDVVRSSIDLRVQHFMRNALATIVRDYRAAGASGIVMDANSGEILAMVSLPDFDPYHPAAAPDKARFNNATLGVFEMGSTFKMFSVAAALNSGLVNFGTVIEAKDPIKYGRHRISDYHAKRRDLTVPEIFIYSSNIGAARLSMTVGTQDMRKFYERMGFFETAPLELAEKGAPLYPRPWRDVHTLTTSFGHGIAVSPVHLVRAAAAMVNGGVLVTPTLVKPNTQRLSPAPVGEQVISPRASAQMRKLMALNVAGGSGKKALVAGYDVGGKTGTAEKNVNGKYVKDARMSSFVGAFPMSDPKYVVVAIIDGPKEQKEKETPTGGLVAAPVVGEVIAHMAPLYRLPPDKGAEGGILAEMKPYLKGKEFVSLGTR